MADCQSNSSVTINIRYECCLSVPCEFTNLESGDSPASAFSACDTCSSSCTPRKRRQFHSPPTFVLLPSPGSSTPVKQRPFLDALLMFTKQNGEEVERNAIIYEKDVVGREKM